MQRRRKTRRNLSNPFTGEKTSLSQGDTSLSRPASVDTHKSHSRDKVAFLIYSLKRRIWLSQFSSNWSTNILIDSKDNITNEQIGTIVSLIQGFFTGSNRSFRRSFQTHWREMSQCERLCRQWIGEEDENNPSAVKQSYLRAKTKSKQVRKKRVYKTKKLTEEQRKEKKKMRERRQEMEKKTESRRERDTELSEKKKEKRRKKFRVSPARQPQKRVRRSEDD